MICWQWATWLPRRHKTPTPKAIARISPGRPAGERLGLSPGSYAGAGAPRHAASRSSPDPAAAISRLHEAGFDPSTTAILASHCRTATLSGTAGAWQWQRSSRPRAGALADRDGEQQRRASRRRGGSPTRVGASASTASVRSRSLPILRYAPSVCRQEVIWSTWEFVPTIFLVGGLITAIALALAAAAAVTLWRQARNPGTRASAFPVQSSDASSKPDDA
jgi:hypothetical protein